MTINNQTFLATATGRLLTTGEVAERLRASHNTVRYWRTTGYGPEGIKVGRRVLYPESRVEAWLSDPARSGERD